MPVNWNSPQIVPMVLLPLLLLLKHPPPPLLPLTVVSVGVYAVLHAFSSYYFHLKLRSYTPLIPLYNFHLSSSLLFCVVEAPLKEF